jgi:hypothetical protein
MNAPDSATVKAPAAKRGILHSPFWLAFILVIAVLALISVYATIRGLAQLAEHDLPEKNAVSLIVHGKVHHLSAEDSRQLFPHLAESLQEAREKLGPEIEAEIDRRVDEAFQPVFGYIPRFTDWYYSLQGEYSRYAAALTGDMAAYMGEKFQQTILAPADLENRLDTVQAQVNAVLAEKIQESAEASVARLKNFIESQTISDSPDYRIKVQDELDLSALLGERLRIGSADIGKTVLLGAAALGVGELVAKGMGAIVVKNVVAKAAGGGTFKLAAALLSKFAAKMAIKGGGAGTAAVAGAALCSPGGPLAVACGVVAGVGTWLLVDEAFILFDEAINREEFEKEISQAVISQREELKAQLTKVYQQAVELQYAELHKYFGMKFPQKIEKTFVPARTAQ